MTRRKIWITAWFGSAYSALGSVIYRSISLNSPIKAVSGLCKCLPSLLRQLLVTQDERSHPHPHRRLYYKRTCWHYCMEWQHLWRCRGPQRTLWRLLPFIWHAPLFPSTHHKLAVWLHCAYLHTGGRWIWGSLYYYVQRLWMCLSGIRGFHIHRSRRSVHQRQYRYTNFILHLCTKQHLFGVS